MYQDILYSVDNPIATITLNRPDRLNAWTDRMGDEVRHAFDQAERDDNVVAIILTGAGRGFCGGADLTMLSEISAGQHERALGNDLAADPGDPEMGEAFRGHYSYLLSIRKPIIAAINGPCAGMAVPIAAFCDMRFASDRAVFTTAFARRGLIAEWGSAWILPRLVGIAHANDLLFSGRKIDAAEAERMGLVNRVLPHDELMKFVGEYARDLAANAAPACVKTMKQQVYQAQHEGLDEAHSKAVRLMVGTFDTADFKEGVQSFLEKRPPHFSRVKS